MPGIKRVGLTGALAAVLLISLAGAAHGQTAGDPSPANQLEDQEWKEQDTSPPPFPKPENLIPAQIGARRSYSFLVDSESLDIGKDGVVRYTLVVRSASGAENISFEGVRCSTHEYKVYAYGTSTKAWTVVRKVDWADLSYHGSNPYRAVLANNYFCPESRPVRTKRELVWDLKNGTGRGFNIEPTM